MKNRLFSFDENSVDLIKKLDLACSLVNEAEKIHSVPAFHGCIRPSLIEYSDLGEVSLAKPKESYAIQGATLSLEIQNLPYFSPEQTGRMNRLVDYRIDFYSLGVLLYEILTGTPPFKSDDILELFHGHIAKKPMPLHERNPNIPEQLSRIILKLFEKNAVDRYQPTHGLQNDLKNCVEQLTANGSVKAFALAEHDNTGQFQILQKLNRREKEIKNVKSIQHLVHFTTNTNSNKLSRRAKA